MTTNTPSPEKHRLTHPKYRPDIDGLRAIAILSVVGFHAFPDWISGGFVGVDIFFVISGYLISGIIFSNFEHNSFSYGEFYLRRIRRIFPALILVLCASFTFGWFILLAGEYKQLGKHMAAGAGFVSNFALWDEAGYFDSAANTKPLLHLWSLGIEEQFYIVWPLLLGFVWKRKHNFLVITLLIAAASFAINVYTVKGDEVAAFYSPLSRFWELMIGGILAYSTLHNRQYLIKNPDRRSLIGLLLIVTAILFLNENREFPGWWALFPSIGAFFVISAGGNARLNRDLLGSRVLVWCGLISYPLYLWHWPLLSFAHILEGESISNEIRIAAVAISFVLAWLTYWLIEKPVRFGGRGKAKAALLCFLMLVIGYIGYNTYARDGLTFRNIQREFFTYDWESGYRYNQCFINGERASSAFAPYCSGVEQSRSSKPLVFLWGDSHAASLYRGLNSQSKIANFELAQFNASGCPPVVDFSVGNSKGCKEINQYVIQKIKALHPDTVILSAYWLMYNGKDKWDSLDYSKLQETIQLLHKLNVPNIVVFGQLPVFEGHQPDIGQIVFKAREVNRTYKKFNKLSSEVDNKIRMFARENNVAFVSPIDLLCNVDGCLISTKKEALSPLAWDYGHLTEAGSIFLIDTAIKNNQFKILPADAKGKE